MKEIKIVNTMKHLNFTQKRQEKIIKSGAYKTLINHLFDSEKILYISEVFLANRPVLDAAVTDVLFVITDKRIITISKPMFLLANIQEMPIKSLSSISGERDNIKMQSIDGKNTIYVTLIDERNINLVKELLYDIK